jgi:hypothetical protein
LTPFQKAIDAIAAAWNGMLNKIADTTAFSVAQQAMIAFLNGVAGIASGRAGNVRPNATYATEPLPIPQAIREKDPEGLAPARAIGRVHSAAPILRRVGRPRGDHQEGMKKRNWMEGRP